MWATSFCSYNSQFLFLYIVLQHYLQSQVCDFCLTAIYASSMVSMEPALESKLVEFIAQSKCSYTNNLQPYNNCMDRIGNLNGNDNYYRLYVAML